MKLESCDVLTYIDDRKGLIPDLSRWAIGKFDHVSLYLGEGFNIPWLYESDGRGVLVKNLQHHTGRLVSVLRPRIIGNHKVKVVNNALEIAGDSKSYYDYLGIIKSCVPRVLKEKIPWLPIPSIYVRDAMMICSEAVAEAFWRAEIEVLSQKVIPLPGDFETSPMLEPICIGRIMIDILP